MRENPATGTDPISQPPDSGFHTFTDDEVKQLRAFWPVGTRERVLIEIASAWGARRSDLYRLGWKHIEGNFLVWDQTKTRADHGLPVPASVWEVIGDLPRDAPAFVVSNKGISYTIESLGNFFRKLRSKAGLKVGGLHSFREKLGADAAEAGASDAEIGAVLGHISARTAQKYRRKANRRKMAVAVFNKLSHMGESGDNPDEPIPSKD